MSPPEGPPSKAHRPALSCRRPQLGCWRKPGRPASRFAWPCDPGRVLHGSCFAARGRPASSRRSGGRRRVELKAAPRAPLRRRAWGGRAAFSMPSLPHDRDKKNPPASSATPGGPPVCLYVLGGVRAGWRGWRALPAVSPIGASGQPIDTASRVREEPARGALAARPGSRDEAPRAAGLGAVMPLRRCPARGFADRHRRCGSGLYVARPGGVGEPTRARRPRGLPILSSSRGDCPRPPPGRRRGKSRTTPRAAEPLTVMFEAPRWSGDVPGAPLAREASSATLARLPGRVTSPLSARHDALADRRARDS